MTDKIVITGLGMVDTLGTSPGECYARLMSDEYIEPIEFETDIDVIKGLKCFKAMEVDYAIPEGVRKPVHTSISVASKNALHVVKEATKDIDSTNVAVVFSSLATKPETQATTFSTRLHKGRRLSPRTSVQYLKDFTAGLIGKAFDFRGACVSMDGACATGLYSLDYATHLLKTHDFVVVGGTDTPAVEDEMYLFSQLGALGTKSCPFDKNRDGFIMGEGAGCLLLEKESTALARGANILGYIESIAHHTDGALGSATSPDLNMTGAIASMKDVTKDLQGDIAFINAHGTSTPIGDDLEYDAIQKVVPNKPIVSFKSKVGHSLASSGINETIYTLMCLRDSVIPANFNIQDCDLEYVYKYKKNVNGKLALKNSFAFGGRSSSIVLRV
jgi:3-oxoacyl-[acyl-carrier-protein] synthase II